MGTSNYTIVPRISEYINKADKIGEIIQWLASIDVIKAELSKCVLGDGYGYAISEGAGQVVKEPEFLPYDLKANGLEIVTSRQVFTSMEGGLDSIICPNCSQNLVNESWGFFDEWASGESDNLTCPLCNVATEIHLYKFEPAWGFSDLGFVFWEWPEFKEEFLEEFTKRIGIETDIVYVHL